MGVLPGDCDEVERGEWEREVESEGESYAKGRTGFAKGRKGEERGTAGSGGALGFGLQGLGFGFWGGFFYRE